MEWKLKCRQAESDRAAARASLAEARRVIEPFAKGIEEIASCWPDGGKAIYSSRHVTFGDIRRAAAFLAKNKPDHNPTEPGDAT